MKQFLIDQNPHWNSDYNINFIKRTAFDKFINLLEIPQVIAITGVRRCGKSTMLKQIMQYLINNKNIPAKNILFLNLEHPYLFDERSHISRLEDLFQDYLSLHNIEGQTYILIDEIQFFENWPVFIKAHYENEKVKFIITGSNSSLLSSEMISLLSGRAIALELYPLSLKEIILNENINIESETNIITNRNKINKHIERLMNIGGFPEALKFEEQAMEIIYNYAQTILLKDIAPRLNSRKTNELEQLFIYLATNISCKISYNLLSKNFNLSDKTIKEYIKSFIDAYLLFEIEAFSYSKKEQLKSLKKIYIIDNGMANSCGFKFSNNFGKLLENLIYLDAKQRNLNIYYYNTKNNLEVDFILKNKEKISPVQVAYNINNIKTFNREIKALTTCLDELNLKLGYLVTFDNKLKYQIDDLRIKHIPAYNWLLR